MGIATTNKMQSLIEKSMCFGNIDVILNLLDEGLDVNTVVLGRKTLLDLAIMHDQLEIVKLLIQRGASVTPVQNRTTPFFRAVYYRRQDIIRFFLQSGIQRNVEEVGDAANGYTALHIAVKQHDVGIVKMLISEFGANANCKSVDGETPLIVACRWEYDGGVELVNFLIENGANVNERDYNDNTALHCAVSIGEMDTILSLLRHGANPNMVDHNGNTPLHTAAIQNDYHNYIKIMEVLLSHGADYQIENLYGDVCLDYVPEQDEEKFREMFEKYTEYPKEPDVE